MIGKAVLLECLEDDRVGKVLCIGRSSIGITHPKFNEILHKDFDTLSELSDRVKDYNTCFYAIGIPSTGISEEQYKKVTYDITLGAAEMLLKNNCDMNFCFVSAAGADSTEKGRYMWARIKGKTENALQTYPFHSVYCFRPGYVQPMKGVRSQVPQYRFLYYLTRPMYFLLKYIPSYVCSSVEFGKAMINAVYFGSDKVIHESKDIVKLGRMKMSGENP